MNTENSQEALKIVRSIFPETPLQFSEYLSEKYDAKIYLKREDLTPIRSYKIRGAFYFISKLSESEKAQGVACASAGNHAQGFAYSCQYFGIKGTVFMPTTTPRQKIIKTKIIGADYIEIKLIGDTFDEAAQATKEFCEYENSIFVPPFNHEKIIIGQATVATEILAQIQEENKIDLLLMPVGGGGLSAGMSESFKLNSPKTDCYCVEPEGAASLTASLDVGYLIELDKVDTFVDGAAVKKIGNIPFEILKKNIINPVILVPENRLCQTMLDFLFHEGIILEPAGGLSIDALKFFTPSQIKGKTIVCVISGGNFDFERLPDVKERAMKYEETKKYIILRLPQRPGALKEFLSLLGPDDDIARFEYLKKSTKNYGSVLLGLETKNSLSLSQLFSKMKERGFQYRDVTHDEVVADLII